MGIAPLWRDSHLHASVEGSTVAAMARLHPAVGGLLFLAGIVLFVVGIVDATAGAPSGGLSRKAADTPWLIFAGIGCSIVGGILFSMALGSGTRRRSP